MQSVHGKIQQSLKYAIRRKVAWDVGSGVSEVCLFRHSTLMVTLQEVLPSKHVSPVQPTCEVFAEYCLRERLLGSEVMFLLLTHLYWWWLCTRGTQPYEGTQPSSAAGSRLISELELRHRSFLPPPEHAGVTGTRTIAE